MPTKKRYACVFVDLAVSTHVRRSEGRWLSQSQPGIDHSGQFQELWWDGDWHHTNIFEESGLQADRKIAAISYVVEYSLG